MRFITICCFLLPGLLTGQLIDNDSLKLKANLSLTGIYQGGNVETVIFRARSEIGYRFAKNWVYNNRNSYVYQEFGRQKADEDILSLNLLYLNPERKVYPLLLAFASTNFRREIDLRYLLGAGVTFQLLRSDKHLLKLSLSSEYEQTDFDRFDFNQDQYDGSRTIATFRGTVWVNGRYRVFDKKLVLSHEAYFQPSLEESDNFRYQADLSVELPVFKHLNFRANYIHSYESIVIEGQERQDQFLTFGFTVKSY